VADLSELLYYIAEQLPPLTDDEVARYHRRHRRAHQRGWCDCDAPPPSVPDGSQVGGKAADHG